MGLGRVDKEVGEVAQVIGTSRDVLGPGRASARRSARLLGIEVYLGLGER